MDKKSCNSEKQHNSTGTCNTTKTKVDKDGCCKKTGK